MRVAKLGSRLPLSSVSAPKARGFTRASSSSFSSKGMAGGLTQDRAKTDADIATLINYHEETKHSFQKYARGPHGLDWINQPNPFRRYAGARVVLLEHFPETPPRSGDVLWPVIFQEPVAARNLDRDSLSQLLYDSLALSAWKVAGLSTWSLRVNPSSGNLHPTEGYVISDAVEGVSTLPFVAHYAPKEHALEIRAELSVELWNRLSLGLPRGSFLIGFSSIFWRESWKYGERAYRYCNHDVGHAMGAVAIAAASLGWNTCMLDGYSGHELGSLLGLPQLRPSTDRGPAKGLMRELETEHADCVIAVFPSGEKISEQPFYHVSEFMGDVTWMGQMNTLSKEHVRWGIIYEAAQASEKRDVGGVAGLTGSVPLPTSMTTSAESFASVGAL